MEAQLTAYLATKADDLAWFCHVDDDNYLNRRALAALLAGYDGRESDWYLGKASIPGPLELPPMSAGGESSSGQRFSFATGGAGFCLSRHLAERMRPWIVGGQFRQLAARIRLPDDVTIGYLVEVILGGRLTAVADLHSHLEPLEGLAVATSPQLLARAVTLSYGRYEDTGVANVITIEDPKDWYNESEETVDFMRIKESTRFYAIHCWLSPTECRKPREWTTL
jgi:fringe protein